MRPFIPAPLGSRISTLAIGVSLAGVAIYEVDGLDIGGGARGTQRLIKFFCSPEGVRKDVDVDDCGMLH